MTPRTPILKAPIALSLAALLGTSVMSSSAHAGPSDWFKAKEQKAPISTQLAPQAGFADLVEQVQPSVVSVKVVRKAKLRPMSDERGYRGPQFAPGSPFQEFFEQFRKFDGPQYRGPRKNLTAQGSGFIISKDGYVVTNNHVVRNGDEIKITLHDGKTHTATVIGSDPKTDLALLKINSGSGFTPVKFAGKSPRVGDWVVAVGNPFGLGGTVTTGVVSARGREIGSGPYDDFLQIDAAINRGNSGGPAFNLNGEVIGVNTAIYSPSGGNVGIGFAIPASMVERIIADLRDDGSVTRGWLGVAIQPLSDDIAQSLELKNNKGALITDVTPASPAARAKLQPGDVIVAVNAQPVKSPRDLARKISTITPSKEAKIDIIREGEKITRSVKIGTLKAPEKKALKSTQKIGSLTDFGIELTNSAEKATVVISAVKPGSIAADKGLRAGDRLLEVAGEKIIKAEQVGPILKKEIKKGRKAILFLVKSGERRKFVALPALRG